MRVRHGGRIGRWALGIVAWTAALVVMLLGVVQLPSVKARIGVAIERAVNQAGTVRIKAEGLSGILPFEVGLSSLEIGDGEGIWLEGTGLTARLDPLALLAGKIRLKTISAQRVLLLRSPRYESRRVQARGFPVGLQVDDFTVTHVVLEPGELELEEVSGKVDWDFHQSTIDLRVSLSGRRMADASDYHGLSVGLFSLAARLRGGLYAPRGEIQLTTSAVATPWFGARATRWSFELDESAGDDSAGQVFRLVGEAEELEGVVSGPARLSADGRLDLARGWLHSQISLKASAGNTNVFLATAMGSGATLEATVDLQKDVGIRIDELRIHGQAVSAQATASYDLRRGVLDTAVEAEVADLGTFSDALGERVSGDLRLTLKAYGPPGALRADIALTANDAVFADLPPLQARATLAAEGLPEHATGSARFTVTAEGGEPAVAELRFAGSRHGDFEVEDLKLRAPGLAVDGGFVFRSHDQVWVGGAEVRSTDLSGLEQFLGLELAGQLAADVTLTATDQGREFRLDASAHDIRIATAASKLGAGDVELDASLTEGDGGRELAVRLAVNDVGIPGGTIRRFDLHAVGDLEHVRITARGEGSRTREFSAQLTGVASVKRRRREFELQKFALAFGDESMNLRAPLRVRTEGGELRLEELDLAIAGGGVSGALVKSADILSGRFEFRGIPLDLLRLYAPELRWRGTLDGGLSISGTPKSPIWSFEASVADLQPYGFREYRVSPVRVLVEGHRKSETARLRAVIEQSEGREFEVSVATDVASRVFQGDPDAAISLALRGQVDLQTLQGLPGFQADRLAGDLRADFKVEGSFAHPTFDGTADLRGGVYESSVAGCEVREVVAEISGDGSGIVLESMRAEDGEGGDLKASGALEFADGVGGLRHRLRIAFSKFHVLERDNIDAVVSGEVSMSGRGTDSKVEGSLQIDRAELMIPEKLPPEIAMLEVVEKNAGKFRRAEVEPRKSRMTAVELDLDLKAPGRVFVRGRDLDTEWKGKLSLGGTVGEPRPSGNLRIVRGTVNLLGMTFRAERGVVGFDGRGKVDPTLDIVAKTQRNAVTAIVTVRGRSSNPEFVLGSEPTMPRDEIVSRLLFAKSSGGLSPVQAFQLADAVSQLAGRGSTGLVQRVRKKLGVDVVEFGGDEKGGSLRVGKYVREGVYLSVNQGLADQGSTATVQVELTPTVRLETEAGADQRNSVELNWRWNY